jgi:hypothetical protein
VNREGFVALAVAPSVALLAALAIGCTPRARMCTASSECSKESACVSGRCQPEKTTVKPAIDSARRLVLRPVDVAYLRSGDKASEGALPPLFALGRDGAILFLRFSVALPQTANVIEAYVVLRRASVVDDDPAPISLHATRIVEGWEGRSTSWATQPRSAETRTPSTLVEPGGPSLVRLDVRDLVRQWSKHDPTDQGIAIVSENETRTGTTFAFTSLGVERSAGSEVTSTPRPGTEQVSADRARGAASALDVEPYLELYVR